MHSELERSPRRPLFGGAGWLFLHTHRLMKAKFHQVIRWFTNPSIFYATHCEAPLRSEGFQVRVSVKTQKPSQVLCRDPHILKPAALPYCVLVAHDARDLLAGLFAVTEDRSADDLLSRQPGW